jgi:hypothetical protein
VVTRTPHLISIPRCATVPENERPELLFAHGSPEFPKGKQRNENTEHYNGSASKLFESYSAGSFDDVSSMNQPLDHFLHNVEGEHEQAKNKSLPRSGNQQCLVFMSSAELGVPDDLSDDQRVNERKGISLSSCLIFCFDPHVWSSLTPPKELYFERLMA